MLLHDWNDGRIAYYTRPPARPDHGHASAAVVPTWSADFNADEVRQHTSRLLCTTSAYMSSNETELMRKSGWMRLEHLQ